MLLECFFGGKSSKIICCQLGSKRSQISVSLKCNMLRNDLKIQPCGDFRAVLDPPTYTISQVLRPKNVTNLLQHWVIGSPKHYQNSSSKKICRHLLNNLGTCSDSN